ncbi:hypothetical protein ACU4GD_29415 [Cupriavidus basilensis]
MLAGLSYRLEGQHNGITQWFRGAAPDDEAPCPVSHLPFAVQQATAFHASLVSWFCL